MSVLGAPPARPAPSRLAPPGLVRVLWLELKRSAVPYLLPPLALLFYYDAIRTADGYPPVWTLRASVVSHLVLYFGLVGGGVAAWAGAREGRRKTADLLATTPRAAWSRLSVALAGALCWVLLAFLGCVAVLYIQTALQATWGGPPLVACGMAAAWTGFTLAGTAQPDAVAGGCEIPALHSAASDQPAAATPDCTSTAGFQVCVAPALSFDLRAVAAELHPVAAEIAGLPGAPTRAEEVASLNGGKTVMAGISGNPAVFEFTTDHVDTVDTQLDGATSLAGWRTGFPQGLLDAFLAGPSPAAGLNPAQQAVEDALLAAVGAQPAAQVPGPPRPLSASAAARQSQVPAVAQRFGALSAGARHAWLATHLAALRAGKITVAQLP